MRPPMLLMPMLQAREQRRERWMRKRGDKVEGRPRQAARTDIIMQQQRSTRHAGTQSWGLSGRRDSRAQWVLE